MADVKNEASPLTAEALEQALKGLEEEGGGDSQNVWHPLFGWVIRNGKATDAAAELLKVLEEVR